jgi:outer membrane protein assembly factor BamB
MGRKKKETIVFCFDAGTGREIWHYSFALESIEEPLSTPTTEGECIYALNYSGILVCLKIKNGKVQWVKDLVKEDKVVRPLYGFSGSPIVEGKLVIVNVNSYGIALEKTTGKVVWSSPPVDWKGSVNGTGSEYATPVIYTQSDKRRAVVFSGNGFYSIDLVNGTPNWFHEWPMGTHAADPIVFDKKVFISSFEAGDIGCALLDISTEKPKVLWRNKNMSSHFSTCVLIEGYLYGCHGRAGYGAGVLRCVDAKSGKIMWEKDLGKPVCVSAASDKLILLRTDGLLTVADASPQAYREFSSAQIIEGEKVFGQWWTTPVLCNGRIYCRNGAGILMCVDVMK